MKYLCVRQKETKKKKERKKEEESNEWLVMKWNTESKSSHTEYINI